MADHVAAYAFRPKRAVPLSHKRAIDVYPPPGPGQHDVASISTYKAPGAAAFTFGVSREFVALQMTGPKTPGPDVYALPGPNVVKPCAPGYTFGTQPRESNRPLPRARRPRRPNRGEKFQKMELKSQRKGGRRRNNEWEEEEDQKHWSVDPLLWRRPVSINLAGDLK